MNVPLSDTTISRRILDLAEDINDKLIDKLKNKDFSLQLDEEFKLWVDVSQKHWLFSIKWIYWIIYNNITCTFVNKCLLILNL